MVGLKDGEKFLRISITVHTQYRRVTDRQTDGQTSCHGIVNSTLLKIIAAQRLD